MSQSTARISRRPTIGTLSIARALSTGLIIRSVLWLIFAGNIGIITGIWIAGGGIVGVVGRGAAIQSVGRLTGLQAGYFALLQVVLVVRLPWLERQVGFDRLTVWHRRNGKLALYLVLIHVVTITIGYAMVDGITVPAEISQFLTYYPWMISAVIGTAIMVVVVLTSLA